MLGRTDTLSLPVHIEVDPLICGDNSGHRVENVAWVTDVPTQNFWVLESHQQTMT